MFVSENLTPLRQKVAYSLRQTKKKFSDTISSTYTQNGAPYVWVKPTGRSTGGSGTCHKIVTHAMLKRFFNDTLGTPLEEVVNDFYDLFPTPMNPVQCVWYNCLTSMSMFTT